jgi:hypothetical protein
MRDDMANRIQNLKANSKLSDEEIFTIAANDFLKACIETGAGNCTEQSMTAAILFNASIEYGGAGWDCTKDQIRDAKINISIAINNQAGGDHTICLIEFQSNGKSKTIAMDPL